MEIKPIFVIKRTRPLRRRRHGEISDSKLHKVGIWKIWEHVAVVIDNHVTSVILMTVRERYRGGAKAIHSTYDLDSEHISRVQWHNTKFTKIHLPIVQFD